MIRICSLVVTVALLLTSLHAGAAPLDGEGCTRLKIEQAALEKAGVRTSMAKGPQWAKANLAPERLTDIKRLIEVDEQILFRCQGTPLVQLPPEPDDPSAIKDEGKGEGKADADAPATPAPAAKATKAAITPDKSKTAPPAVAKKAPAAKPAEKAASAPPAQQPAKAPPKVLKAPPKAPAKAPPKAPAKDAKAPAKELKAPAKAVTAVPPDAGKAAARAPSKDAPAKAAAKDLQAKDVQAKDAAAKAAKAKSKVDDAYRPPAANPDANPFAK
jgi:hypothetical protein